MGQRDSSDFSFMLYTFATSAPLMLCHTLKMAPGMAAIGKAEK